ncbi:MAG: hypothetical protein HUJ56_00035, partial [Erysipelotrichaceae bacterium]|nr:hypothetical protein [Erysipelotrichaceae bacterium]
GQTWVDDANKATIAENNAKLPVEGFAVSDLHSFYAGYSNGNDEVANNSIAVGNVEQRVASVVGGYSMDGSVISYEVEITDGNYYERIFGGISESQDPNSVVKGNKVTISGDSPEFGLVNGGSAAYSSVTENVVIIEAGNGHEVQAGFSVNGSATGNIVNIKGGSIKYITGAYSNSKSATGNIVNINGGSISEYVAGGDTVSGSATSNIVNINAGTVKNVYGSVVSNPSGSAENNTVNWKAGEIQGNVYGSVIKNSSVYTPVESNGGTFNVYQNSDGTSKELATGKLGGFDYMNFILDNADKLDNPVVSTDKVILSSAPKFGVAVIDTSNLKEGDSIKLLQANSGLEDLTPTLEDNYSVDNMPEGIMPIYKSEISSIQNENNVITLTYQG